MLDALRSRGYDIRSGSVSGTALDVALPSADATPEEIVARSVTVLEGEFDENQSSTSLYRFVRGAVEKRLIENALDQSRGNQLAAARLLGINRNTLRSRIQRLGVSVRRGRESKEEATPRVRARLLQSPQSPAPSADDPPEEPRPPDERTP